MILTEVRLNLRLEDRSAYEAIVGARSVLEHRLNDLKTDMLPNQPIDR